MADNISVKRRDFTMRRQKRHDHQIRHIKKNKHLEQTYLFVGRFEVSINLNTDNIMAIDTKK